MHVSDATSIFVDLCICSSVIGCVGPACEREDLPGQNGEANSTAGWRGTWDRG